MNDRCTEYHPGTKPNPDNTGRCFHTAGHDTGPNPTDHDTRVMLTWAPEVEVAA